MAKLKPSVKNKTTTVGELREILKDLPDNAPITFLPVGSVSEGNHYPVSFLADDKEWTANGKYEHTGNWTLTIFHRPLRG